MAKDGTCRGGARVGAGAKKKPLADKISAGNPGGRKLTVMEFTDAPALEGYEMPEPNKMLSAEQKDGTTLAAGEIYKNTWTWLNARGCLARHPTTGNAIQSPYVAMGQNYMSQTNRLWYEIFQIVKENCTGEYSGSNPQDDVMERLLTARRGK